MTNPTAPLHSVSVAAAIVREDGRILAIQRRDNGHWEPPGGVLEIGETIEDGLRREVFEETGLVVEVERLSGVYKNMSRGIIALVFRCHVAGGELVATEETAGYAWLTSEEIGDRMDEAYAVRLVDAHLSEPMIREHDGVELIRSCSA